MTATKASAWPGAQSPPRPLHRVGEDPEAEAAPPVQAGGPGPLFMATTFEPSSLSVFR